MFWIFATILVVHVAREQYQKYKEKSNHGLYFSKEWFFCLLIGSPGLVIAGGCRAFTAL